MRPKTGHPQLEDGYTRIANELLEALIRYPFSAGECKVLLGVIRLTYGWRRRSHPISQRALAVSTGLSPRQIRRILTGLRQQALLLHDRTTQPHTYQLNKAYLGWRDWPGGWPPDIGGRSFKPGCELSAAADGHVRAAGDMRVPPLFSKEKKEKKEYAPESREAVHNVPALESNERRFVDGTGVLDSHG